ncbi:(S)-2,3-di-O-geranylgeranylglyceryl phosphate synthase [Natronomonas pharaonis DSM 2160]|uniref:Digeranylgeranylglyceryl phosphate synthase n=1 Tax=Natronomonas pharaonis (strain ATCC 35678 / DSM 2160 / CIP 103997 / JCM 8858 / NBRC 14720 / NCIMB 2260 / Gabara) TaxID=348780 RepID=DGGGP_NATPD|nr:geranylgeranylglycerol-phosphate geranylgeranyltransferase [Natronomonas pharaonis]Q3INH7.1 RecName: Full=Digeranylgeranylglyceryl phosphate synthase; Short=DGGGP synthase; Short=DGGGPS; AltName: Full=(S)-2,3-di-O-geranylgeranylglyceryl phosphate synthase; AltName: Full=Geranylgeranylglycerol-phosphate geranylgeranyltransferase [Natronomonas pharaonis DSM 2160]CAI50326.1 (S)-2,3-di-O-geranylgeranylglyceryl phosphate synthase [Natronomonas pharaonis DSM 2160]
MERVRGLVELLRPGNAVAAGGLTFIGAFVAGGLSSPQSMAFAVVATVLATGAGNAINDYFDRDIDAINEPDRPIPRGAVSPRGALVYSVALFAVAVVLTLLLPWLAIAIAAINLVALVAYTEVFKGLPGVGNALVAYLTGSTFLYGGAAVGGDLAAVVVLFALAACATMAREIVKDVEDIDGDRAEGLRTLPIVIGERRSLYVAAGFVVVAVLSSPLPYLLGLFGWVYLVVLVPALCGLAAATWRSFSDPTTGQAWLKASMFAAAVAFVIGRLAVVA